VPSGVLGELTFDLPQALFWGLPLALASLAPLAWRRRRMPAGRLGVLLALRFLAFATLALLLARPVAVAREDPRARRSVTLLVDRSKSMALREQGTSRYDRARELAEARLIPALEGEGWEVDALLFADAAFPAGAAERREAIVDGPATDLGGALVHALRGAATPPLAVVAVTDGAANVAEHNRAALVGLVDAGIPFIGIGVGDDEGVASLSLEGLGGPTSVPPDQIFKLTARLQAVGAGEVPAFDLVLLRDGEVAQARRVAAHQGSRVWTETFELVETAPGLYEYTVELQAPPSHDLVTVSTRASAPVNVSAETTFRVLFAQGALTWNFKFIGRALRGDPGVSLTGLSRTSEQSMFRQNVESAGELLDGFPGELTELAPYRVLILSDLGPADLTPRQQETVARFVGELGGGLLMIGGVATFNASWQGSRLEGLLPVTFDDDPGVLGLDRPFQLRLTERALGHPAFQLAESGNREAWEGLPTFTHYGRVREAKPGATVWARHAQDAGPDGRRILMASQHYGAGVSAVIAVQNLWRWRLAKDLDPAHFDRFWKQLLRFLGQAGGQEISVQFLDPERGPGREIRALVERRPRPEAERDGAATSAVTVQVEDPSRRVVLEQELELAPLRPAEIRFRADEEGVYAVKVHDAEGVQLASRPLEIRSVDREMERTGRDLENLRQWASLTQGIAMPIEACRDLEQLTAQIRGRAEALRASRERRVPVGVNGWVLGWLLACLGGEWALRKRWNLP
jgi:uncharacterized membrane protein